MASITTINGSDNISTSDTVINTNFSNLNSDKIETSTLDTDTTLAANSDSKIPTQKAVKTYVDAGGNVNASETTKGIVEEATDAEVTAGTATGATGAKLFVTPAKLATRIIGLTNPVIITYLSAASPATWTKPVGLKYIIAEVQGAGGNGAGGSGGGGGGGAYEKKVIAAASLGTTETVTIGAGGVGTGNTSFGTLVVSPNGANASGTSRGVGGSATGGDLNISGGNGKDSQSTAGGAGGGSFYGNGGEGGSATPSNITAVDGQPAYGYGGGGGGGGSAADGSPTGAAGSGTEGIVIVTEYYS
jgi:hypothetical protein